MGTNSNPRHKVNDLFPILNEKLQGKMNLARIKLISRLVVAMCVVRHVGLHKLAMAFGSKADSLSSMRTIQRFLAGFKLDLSLIARLVFGMLPERGPYVLSMDRTNWQFGSFDINALVLAVTYKGVAIPVLFKLLPKRGNSNTDERIAIVDRFITLFGHECIDCLVADREFVGERWLEYLNNCRIRYYLRVRNNFWAVVPRTGERIRVSWLFTGLHHGQSRHMEGIYIVNGQHVYLSAAMGRNSDGKPELMILVSFNKPDQAVAKYKLRWQIETCFKAMKTSGFNIEDTHLQEIKRIERLFAVMTIAFVWAYIVGVFKDAQVKAIRTLKNGRRAFSYFKYGLDEITCYLLKGKKYSNFDIFKILACT